MVAWSYRHAAVLAVVGALAIMGLAVGVSPAATATSPKVGLSLSQRTTTAGSSIRATVRIHLPAGRSLGKASLRWGDGTARTEVTRKKTTLTHTYTTPGTFHVVVKVVDDKGTRAKTMRTEVVTAPSGSYSGHYVTGGAQGALSFYVGADHAQIQDVSANISVTCTPGATRYALPFVLDHLPVKKDGTFDTTVHRTGVIDGATATFEQTLRGHLGGVDSLGAVQASGSLISKVSYDNGTSYVCTSGSLSWTLTRDQQPTPQPTALPLSGSYSGGYFIAGTQGAVAFYVAADRRTIQDMSLNAGYGCTPAGSTSGLRMVIDTMPVASDGSFHATSTYDGVYSGAPATFTLAVTGHFHGTNAQGVVRAAGSLVGTVTYDDGTSYTCTSSALPFSMTRDQQPTPQPTAVSAGDYSGYYYVSGGQGALHYTVSPQRTEIQDLASTITVGCSPGGNQGAVSVAIDSVALAADGSFSRTVHSSGTFAAHPASFTFIFKGHWHGTSGTGHPRFAGSVRVDATYDDGGTHQCTSDVLPWVATAS